MEREVIAENIKHIPKSELGVMPKDDEIWEANDGEAHLKVTRHQLPFYNGPEFFSLSVSGPSSERQRVVQEFSQILGEPIANEYWTIVDVIAWIIN